MKRLFCFFFFTLAAFTFAEIIESHDITDLLSYAEEETLVVSDINETLIQSSQSLGSDRWASYMVKKMMSEQGISRREALHRFVPSWHKILRVTNVTPVEPKTAGVIYLLQKKGIRIVGLTARYIEMAFTTHDQLLSVGIDFSKNTIYPFDCEIEGGFAAKFIDGIIFNGLKNDKGEILVRFFNRIGCRPKKVIYIDDKLSNIQSVQAAIEKENIPFLGIHYTSSKESPFDLMIANEQWKRFGKVLSDEEASTLINYPKYLIIEGEHQ